MEDGSSLMAQWVKNAGDTGDSGSTSGLGSSPGGRHGNSLQYSCLENPHGQRSLEGYHPWGCKESDTTESKHGSSIMFLSKSFVSVTIMIPLTKPRFHSESLQLFWLPTLPLPLFSAKFQPYAESVTTSESACWEIPRKMHSHMNYDNRVMLPNAKWDLQLY